MLDRSWNDELRINDAIRKTGSHSLVESNIDKDVIFLLTDSTKR